MQRVLPLAVLVVLLFAPAAGAWSWPAGGDVVQPFTFDAAHPYAAGQHRGIDVAGDPGTTVVAPEGGSISFAGTVPSSGKSVTILTGDGYAVTLTHLGSIAVGKGAAVSEGDAVGTIGPSGDAEVGVPYVHLGVRIAADEQGYLDPATLLPPRPSASSPPDPAPAPPTSTPVADDVPAAPAPPAAAPAVATAAPAAPAASPSPLDVPAPAVAPPAPTPRPALPTAAPAARPLATTPRHERAVSHTNAVPDENAEPLATRPKLGQSRVAAPSRAVDRPATRAARPRLVSAPVPARPVKTRVRPARGAVPEARQVSVHPGRAPRVGRSPQGHALVAADPRRTGRSTRGGLRPSVAWASPHDHPATRRRPLTVFAVAALLALAVIVGAVVFGVRRAGRARAVRMIAASVERAEESAGGACVAVCGGTPPPWPRGGVRRSVRRLRALPPPQGERRPHGQRDGRARYAGDGDRRSRGEVLR